MELGRRLYTVWLFMTLYLALLAANVSLPELISQPEDQIVKQGAGVLFSCKFLQPDSIITSWLKDGKTIDGYGDTSHHLITPQGDLVIMHSEMSDMGRYVCRGTNKAGSTLSAEAVLTVRVLDVAFQRAPSNVTVLEGGQASLLCTPPTGSVEPQVSWEKNGEPVVLQERIQQTNHSLVFTSVVSSDTGFYHCVASNEVQKRVSPPAYLLVPVLPVFITTPEDQKVESGTMVTLECSAGGMPKPSISWRHDGVLIRDSSKYVIKSETLTILKVSHPEDSGQYSCSATNQAGSIESHVTLSVTEQLFLEVPPGSVSFTRGQLAHIPCRAVPRYPPASLMWKRTGDTLKLFQDSSSGRFRVTESGDLEIVSIEEEDEGDYECEAITEDYSQAVSVHISITESASNPPPLIRIPPFDQSLRPGGTVQLPCLAAPPWPTITWTHNGQAVNDHKDVRITVFANGSLEIRNLMTSDSGIYSCTATSLSGSQTAKAKLTVNPDGSSESLNYEVLPQSPNRVTVIAITPSSIQLIWYPPTNPGTAEVSGYEVLTHSKGSESWHISQVPASLIPYQSGRSEGDALLSLQTIGNNTPLTQPVEYTKRHLIANTLYTLAVRAKNKFGLGEPYVLNYKVYTLDYPSMEAPDSLSEVQRNLLSTKLTLRRPLVVNSSCARISWMLYHNQMTVKAFELQLTSYSLLPGVFRHFTVDGAGVRSYMLCNLTPWTLYGVKAKAFSSGYQYSTEDTLLHTFKTLQAPPSGAPRNVAAKVNGTSVTITWEPPPIESVNGELVGYIVQFMTRSHKLYNLSIPSNVTKTTVAHYPGIASLTIQVAAQSRAPSVGVFSSPLVISLQPASGYGGRWPWIIGGFSALLWLVILSAALLIYRRKAARKTMSQRELVTFNTGERIFPIPSSPDVLTYPQQTVSSHVPLLQGASMPSSISPSYSLSYPTASGYGGYVGNLPPCSTSGVMTSAVPFSEHHNNSRSPANSEGTCSEPDIINLPHHNSLPKFLLGAPTTENDIQLDGQLISSTCKPHFGYSNYSPSANQNSCLPLVNQFVPPLPPPQLPPDFLAHYRVSDDCDSSCHYYSKPVSPPRTPDCIQQSCCPHAARSTSYSCPKTEAYHQQRPNKHVYQNTVDSVI